MKLSYVRQVVENYYWRKGLTVKQVRTRYNAIKTIVLYNGTVEQGAKEVKRKELEPSINLENLKLEFKEILVKLGKDMKQIN